ncbi:MAG: nicotinate phosphoribosyltransferase [Candidatus Niyogibacteria bacterium RIFCSPHIGHO2_01_FULL_45_28]|uniref:Nicotinate phosphoribosyltransferase n=1 Tax=Candidatus Niyogibacteria bacterium RIFCSPLOWO2_02_FULL_45_13 TaxID=1801725 RepID=A0A1G2EXA6_9BACT|nr:MAG: nicotinate phosphoribosyltransferase [Candidatus Niyogibacteria bacterium RIFCSPHIGHO2_01_FULL_45_28]OGZ30357.1 MAG: nicotinate phosphoribosyltransferase [Candidatus Niyogibacteria bacterium RIFCSPLOWO2_02_FULL_45_13]
MTEFKPIINSLMDVDFYKLTMGQLIWRYYPDVNVTFELMNRTKKIRVADLIDMDELVRQLDHARSLRFKERTEIYYLRGMDVYGERMFQEGYIKNLIGFRLPPYELSVEDGQLRLRFSGKWIDVSMWETIAMSIVSELRVRAGLALMSKCDIEIMYQKADIKQNQKLTEIKKRPHLTISDFATRRRHGFGWHKKSVEEAVCVIREQLSGTSNTLLAFLLNLIPIGTSAHELQMVLAALLPRPEDKRRTQYQVLYKWQDLYGDGLRIFLPDTFGTDQFLEDAPREIAVVWRGSRQDSGDPFEYGEKLIAWYKKHEVDPTQKLIIFSDGLDVGDIIQLEEYFRGRIKVTFGWGTLFANDFRGCYPEELAPYFAPASVICKPVEAEGRPTVKLSDNVQKATGDPEAVKEYLKIFGEDRRRNIPVFV